MEQRLSRQRNTICRLVEESDIKMFWEQFKNIFTEENDNIWNALSEGLTKYHAILKGNKNYEIVEFSSYRVLISDRKFLHDEVVDLRQQNQDLKILLAKYMDNPDDPNLEPPCAMQRSSPPGTRARKL